MHDWTDDDGKGKYCSKCKEPHAVSRDTKPKPQPIYVAPGPARTLERNVSIDLKNLDRHPINRHPRKASIENRAASMQTDGQRDACEVRKMPGGRYQMISGETRWMAAASLKWKQLRCDVIECDDVEARRRVASHNAEREDLNAVEQAKLIEELQPGQAVAAAAEVA
ncbi:ParB/RepB/Spo0J family partition protein [Anatilimnocola floriformis]|uniref:ParB/RepB/Spo0J family partition protein n=1 Tax=Anatilimnocola floriformis TaxID=2948575 RepID=UPI0020C1D71A|nr:ParB N-terminal domain-containing protein [Anatilimnocola floriformis]